MRVVLRAERDLGMGKLFAAIDTPGGHMVICLFLIVAGVGAHLFIQDPLLHDLVIASEGVLFGAMKGQNGAKMSLQARTEQSDPPKT